MLILLSAVEAVKIRDVLNRGLCRSDGSVEIDLPIFSQSQPAGRAGDDLQFSADYTTVSCGGSKVKLTTIQFALLRLLASQQRVSAEEAQDSVWGTEAISDNAIRLACSRLSTRLLDAGIPYAISYRRGFLSLDSAAS